MTNYIAERVPELGNNLVIMRDSGGDRETLQDVIAGYHLPPEDFEVEDGIILDLGSHIGLTALDMAVRYPQSTVRGIEIENENWLLAAKNLSYVRRFLKTRDGKPNKDIEVIWGGVSGSYDPSKHTKGMFVTYQKNVHGHNATKIGPGEDRAWAYTIDQLVPANSFMANTVDYIKMDIEGEEYAVLQAGGDWPRYTRCISVEIHEPHTKETIAPLLENLGFTVQDNPRHFNSLYGIK